MQGGGRKEDAYGRAVPGGGRLTAVPGVYVLRAALALRERCSSARRGQGAHGRTGGGGGPEGLTATLRRLALAAAWGGGAEGRSLRGRGAGRDGGPLAGRMAALFPPSSSWWLMALLVG